MEKICRYIARPPIAAPRLHLTPKGDVVYQFKRPWKDGTHSVCLTQLAFVERLAALVPPPRRHLLTYHGVLAPNAALRARVVPAKPESLSTTDPKPETPSSKSQPTPQEEEKPSRYYPWAYLLNRVFGRKPWICPRCGGPRHVISQITDPMVAIKIIDHHSGKDQPRLTSLLRFSKGGGVGLEPILGRVRPVVESRAYLR